MYYNSTNHNDSSADNIFFILLNVRLIVKFYIWPLLVLFGLIGNFLSILVLTRRRLIRTSTNNYLTVLAVFDSCYLVFTLILNFGSHSTFSNNPFTQTLLYFLRPLADFSSNTATWLIVCFTLERTLAVARPIYAKRTCSVRRSRHLICTLLIICFLITLPTYFERKFTRDVNNIENKNNSFNATERINLAKQKEYLQTFHRLYLIFICIVIIWIPLILLCVCNSILIWYVHRSRRFDVDVQPKPADETIPITSSPSSIISKSGYCSNNYSKSSVLCSSNITMKNPYTFDLRRHSRSYIRKRKVTIVLIFCLFVALLLWTPQSLSLTYETLIESYTEMSPKNRNILLIFNNFANLFLCINASIDFILYCFLSEKFARTCQQIIWRQCSNYKINSKLRSRMVALDRGSFIVSNTSNNIHHQQQQLAANTTNSYYTQLYNFYSPSPINSKNKEWKKKFVQTLTTTTTANSKYDHRVYYRTSLLENKQKMLHTKKKSNHQRSVGFEKQIEMLSNTEDDYTNNEINISVNTSLSSNKQSHSDTTCHV
ncbi:unnamed protein product [Adineta steineri]|uniref:G-protein coupled receptors family 1 profile domain-containing protein n=1 Tax=Adineta steineri TaxID=433720 RepID=A0A813TRQ8_9BILA|nr:unnamed protein product [Adineta steineri]CAF3503915.1 unnamed protein product [Adineta steineri]